MDRRTFATTSLAALAATRLHGQQPTSPTKPNILFLMSDQHRGDCLGADGDSAAWTPNLDRLAAEGARYRCAYSSVPSCTPARAGLLTGLAPWNHGMLGYGRIAAWYRNQMPRLLGDAGYRTAAIGKNHFWPQRLTHGYDEIQLDESGRVESPGFVSDYRQWFREVAPDLDPDATGLGWNDHRARPYALPERLHPTVWTADRAVEYLEDHQRRQGEEPFFLKVSFARPHSPYDPPQRFWDAFADADLPPASIGDWAEEHALRGQEHGNNLARGDLGAEQVRRSRRGYWASVAFLDEQIGRILDTVTQRGLLDNTLIVYTSDHGDMTGDHHLWRKTYAYDASARVPLLVRWPEAMTDCGARGVVRDETAELRDMLPTFLDAAGVGYDPVLVDGRSLLEPLRGEAEGSDWRAALDLEHSRVYWPENQWHALTDGRWKYIYFAPTGQEQLFDLQEDPKELRDLAQEPNRRRVTRDWRRRLYEHLEERGEPFVRDGDLAGREEAVVYSPNYPRRQPLDG